MPGAGVARGGLALALSMALSGTLATSAASPAEPVPVAGPATVAPAAGSSMAGVARDGAVSAALSDGRSFWAFADTLAPRAVVSSSAAYAGPGASLAAMARLREPTAAPGVPYRLVDPRRRTSGATVPDCPAGMRLFTWPSAVTARPRGAGDEVTVFVAMVCGRPDLPVAAFRQVATGLAVLQHRHGDTPTRATLVDGQLFGPGPAPGQAAARRGNRVWTWWCDTGACHVGRVDADRVTDASAYRFRRGDGWVTRATRAGAIGLPPCCERPSVVLAGGRWVAVGLGPLDAPAPQGWFATAARPWGPWSAPTAFDLPGCTRSPDPTSECRAVQVHARGSTRERLRVSWFDPTVPTGGTFGAVPLRGVTLLADLPVT